jgi:RNA polymerase sigma factor (sigma-70 family)
VKLGRAAQTAVAHRYRYLDGSEKMSLSCPAIDLRFEAIFRTHYRRLAALLVRITGDLGVAEELASEALWRLSTAPNLAEAEGNLEGWLYRTAMNLGLDALRVRNRRTKFEGSAAIEARRHEFQVNPLDAVLADERRERVRKVLAAMNPVRAQRHQVNARPAPTIRVGRFPKVTFRLCRRASGSYLEDNQTAKENCNCIMRTRHSRRQKKSAPSSSKE